MLPELRPFFEAVRSMSPAQAGSRLLGATDRDLSALLSRAEEAERAEVLSLLSTAKRKRLEEDIARMRHVRLSPSQLEFIARFLASQVSGSGSVKAASRYFKPAR